MPFTPYRVDDTEEALWDLYPLLADRDSEEYVFLRLFFRIARVSNAWRLLSSSCHRGSREKRKSRLHKVRDTERSGMLNSGSA